MGEDYRKVLGSTRGLRRGFTTGTAAQAAAAAALKGLITGEKPMKIGVTLPGSNKPFSGREIIIPIESWKEWEDGSVSASVVKDAGDDKDDTDGLEIFARAAYTLEQGIIIDGGKGVGRVTGKGLPVKPGEPAINPVPRRMIIEEAEKLINSELWKERFSSNEERGIRITISAPLGEEAAAKTWNGRIGIKGGISIIGTSGVVEPSSETAFKASLGMVIKAAAREREGLIILSGHVGECFAADLGFEEKVWVTVGDYIGYALSQAAVRGFNRVFLPLHLGKLTKIAAGIFNTHSRFGDARLETLAAAAGACGAAAEQIQKLLSISLTEEAIPLIEEWKLEESFYLVAERAKTRCEKELLKTVSSLGKKSGKVSSVETAALDLKGRPIGWSGSGIHVEEICRNFR